jgi:dTDP-4-amino-4,6-dideoxygalactose transaminase
MREELQAAMDCVVEGAQFVLGPAVEEFERRFAEFSGALDCVGVGSGTHALHLAMHALGVGPGDEVITVSMSFVATAWPILYLGARPIFVDIDPASYTMDPEQLEAAFSARTKAIVPVHLYGRCADMETILSLAEARGVAVIEDVAQAPGAEHRGRQAGSMGDLGCFSFYPSKNLGAFGEAGAVTTRSRKIAKQLRVLRDHAQQERYRHVSVGYNYRLDSLQAAVLTAKLGHLEAWNTRRREIAARYDHLLSDSRVVTPAAAPDREHVYHLYVIRHRARDGIRNALAERGVQTAVHYPTPIHFQKPFRDMGWKPGDLPVTEELSRTCLSIPLYPELHPEQIERVASAVRDVAP